MRLTGLRQAVDGLRASGPSISVEKLISRIVAAGSGVIVLTIIASMESGSAGRAVWLDAETGVAVLRGAKVGEGVAEGVGTAGFVRVGGAEVGRIINGLPGR